MHKCFIAGKVRKQMLCTMCLPLHKCCWCGLVKNEKECWKMGKIAFERGRKNCKMLSLILK